MKAFLLLGVLIGLAAFITPSTATATEDTESDAGTELSPENGKTDEGHIEQPGDAGAVIDADALTALGGRRKRSAQSYFPPGYDPEDRRKRFAQVDLDDDDNDRRKRNAQLDDLITFRKREIGAQALGSLAGGGGSG